MTATCACCGEPMPEAASTGRPARFLNDAHRKAYERGVRPRVSGRPAEEAPAEAPLPAAVRKLPQRTNLAAGLGDGDWCPQDDGHGRMYFMKPTMTRQWCPSSGHQGSAFYRRDGVTPSDSASPARHDLASSGQADVKQGRAEPEAPVPPGRASHLLPHSRPGIEALGVAPIRSAAAPGVTVVHAGDQADGDPAGSERAMASASPGRTPHPVGDPASAARAQAGTEGAGQLSLVLPSG